MDKEQLVEKMASMFYDEYRKKLKDLPDKELLRINRKNAGIIANTPVDTNNFQSISKLYAEGIICKEIIEKREKTAEALKDWVLKLEDRRTMAIINLPTACSEIGQLIAAILEFNDGLSLEEISKYDERLQSLNQNELSEKLTALENEGIIYSKKSKGSDAKYFLLDICNETLFPEKPVEFVKRCFNKFNDDIREKDIEIIKYIAKSELPISKTEIEENLDIHFSYADIERFTKKNILKKEYIGDETTFYFTMLGERGN